MLRSKSYQETLIASLKDPMEAQEYLNAALEDDAPEVFLLALRDVAEAQLGSVSQLAELAQLNREHLYRVLSKQGNPAFSSLHAILSSLGFRLKVEPQPAHPSLKITSTKNSVD